MFVVCLRVVRLLFASFFALVVGFRTRKARRRTDNATQARKAIRRAEDQTTKRTQDNQNQQQTEQDQDSQQQQHNNLNETPLMTASHRR